MHAERRKKVDQLTHKYKVNKSRIIRKRLQEAKNELSQEYSRREEETSNSRRTTQPEPGRLSTK